MLVVGIDFYDLDTLHVLDHSIIFLQAKWQISVLLPILAEGVCMFGSDKLKNHLSLVAS